MMAKTAAQPVGLVHVLGREQHGDALGVEVLQVLPDRQAALGVEAGGGLVQEEDVWTVHERPGQVDAPPHAAGVRPDLAAANAGQPHELEQLVGAVVGLGASNAIETPLQNQEIASLREIVQADFL